MAGFNNTPPASEFHRHSSWGRTRQPKNIAGTHGTQTAAPTNVNPAAATDGYSTENQRFLHVHLKEATAADLTVQVWAYSHAFGTWGVLTDVRGNACTLTANNSSVAQVFEISGVDRVYFKLTAGNFDPAADELFAACSTF